MTTLASIPINYYVYNTDAEATYNTNSKYISAAALSDDIAESSASDYGANVLSGLTLSTLIGGAVAASGYTGTVSTSFGAWGPISNTGTDVWYVFYDGGGNDVEIYVQITAGIWTITQFIDTVLDNTWQKKWGNHPVGTYYDSGGNAVSVTV